LQELAKLIGLGFAMHVLEIHQFLHLRMDKDVMAAADPRQMKPKSFGQRNCFAEADIL